MIFTYCKIVILSTSAYFLKSAARMGAYFQGVIINGCNFLVMCSCVGTEYILCLEGFFC